MSEQVLDRAAHRATVRRICDVTESKRDDERTSNYTELDVRYQSTVDDVSAIIDFARRSAVRSNEVMTASYWLIGRHIVILARSVRNSTALGTELAERLSSDLTHRFGNGFQVHDLSQMSEFYLWFPFERNGLTTCEQSASGVRSELLRIASEKLEGRENTGTSLEESLVLLADRFPLPWSCYARLLSVENRRAQEFYESEATRLGWSADQLDRHIISLLYDRAVLSRGEASQRAQIALHANERRRPSLKDVYSVGDWILLRFQYGREVAVRDSELDVDYGTRSLTVASHADLSNIEGVDGPESAIPGEPSTVHPLSKRSTDAYVALDECHSEYSNKRGRLGSEMVLVDFDDDPPGEYFEVKFPDGSQSVMIHESCVYGRCRKYFDHVDRWLLNR